ncbi:MAG TPA: Wadjet anti-phage system protein JetA family protein [Blastocatellia bacterium]|nr:Wadjet anti-phage system protein JetA family protein [Blastocatellia bacterium]
MKRVLQRLQASQILEQFFTNYRQEIVDRVYHQLRTTDHVARFRLGALDALAKIERGEDFGCGEPVARRWRSRAAGR